MAFKLNNVVPWGRSFEEYRLMFKLNDEDINKKIAGFGDGPASFNYEATKKGYSVTSFDPIYEFTREQLYNRINQVRHIVMEQMRENADNYVWKNIKDLDGLERLRMSAMELFLSDYEKGRSEKRYVYHELPKPVDVKDKAFDLGLSSHFLLMYTELGYDFHIKAISEMLRACKEVRIFPVLDLDGNSSELTANVIDYFRQKYVVEMQQTEYEFQKGGNKLLVIKK